MSYAIVGATTSSSSATKF